MVNVYLKDKKEKLTGNEAEEFIAQDVLRYYTMQKEKFGVNYISIESDALLEYFKHQWNDFISEGKVDISSFDDREFVDCKFVNCDYVAEKLPKILDYLVEKEKMENCGSRYWVAEHE